MRILGLTVVRNESSRWLDCALTYAGIGLSGLFVYDDQSDDDSALVAEMRHCVVERRPDDVPSFMTHEGRFRQAAWEAFQRAFEPEPDDWVLALDADEILLVMEGAAADPKLTFPALWEHCTIAMECDKLAVELPIFEVFSVAGDGVRFDSPKIRVDGYWGQISAPRLFRYQPGGLLQDRHFGCGSVPSYVMRGRTGVTWDLGIVHLGYALPEDQLAKYERYHDIAGHNEQHVESILGPRQLADWHGPKLKVWRGRG